MYRIIQSILNIFVLCLCIQTVKTTLNSPTYSVPQDTSPRVTSKYSASRPSSLFLCSNGRKIDHSWQCDGENDCGDNSDESHCPRSWHRQLEVYHKCHPNETYSCVGQGNKCILNSKVCDHQRDCPDGDDEGDHCRTNPCYELNCALQCEANGTVPYCTCRDGFKLNDGSNCEDVNECDSRVCSQQCRNTKGGFECSCIKGYELVNRTMCLAKDTSPILYYSIGREIRGFDIRENITAPVCTQM